MSLRRKGCRQGCRRERAEFAVGVRVAVDFGTSSTCVVLSVDGHEPQVVVVDGQPLVPSAVFAGADGTLFVGQEAERQAAVDPSRYEPHPKRRIDEGELLLGDTVLPVPDAVRAVLSRAVGEATRLAGGSTVDVLVLTHPADWGAVRTRVLRQAASGLAREVVLVPEPVAAAVFHAAAYPEAGGRFDGAALAVLDLGGGTVDASVVRRDGGQFRVLATKGDPSFGGADIDQALLEYAGTSVAGSDPDGWQALMEGRDLAARRRRRVLRQDVRGAKETLSRHTYTDIPMPPPFPDAHVTRDALEQLIGGPLAAAADLVLDTVREAGLTPRQLLGVFLVGGSSRIPLVSRLVHQRAGVVPTTLDQPETVVARGALRAISQEPDRPRESPPAEPPRRAAYPQNPVAPPPVPANVPSWPPTAGQSGPVPTSPADSGAHPAAWSQAPAVAPHGGPLGNPAGFESTSGPYPVHGLNSGGYAVTGLNSGGYPVNGLHSGGYAVTGLTSGGYPVPTHTAAEPEEASGGAARRWMIVGTVAALVIAGAATAIALFRTHSTPPPAPTTAAAPAAREIEQYDYRFVLPDGWAQSGGDATKRRVQLKPSDAAPNTDLLLVQESKLTYDATANRAQAIREIHQGGYDAEAAQGLASGFLDNATFANRNVVYYREHNAQVTADWYVFFQGKTEISVACQYTPSGQSRVHDACDQVVRTMAVAG